MDRGEGFAISVATRVGDSQRVAELLDDDPSLVQVSDADSGETLLHLAAAFGHAEVVRLLIERGAAVNAEAYYHYTPLSSVLRSKPEGWAQVARLIEEAGGLEHA